jgi:hypothetical protein
MDMNMMKQSLPHLGEASFSGSGYIDLVVLWQKLVQDHPFVFPFAGELQSSHTHILWSLDKYKIYLTVRNVMVIRNCDGKPGKLNAVRICVSANYVLQLFSELYCHVLGGSVTIDRVWDYWFSWPLTGHTTKNCNAVAIFTLYSSLLHTLVFSVYYSLHYPFPGSGF